MNPKDQCSNPSLVGRVTCDCRMAHKLGECYDEELQAIAAYIYRCVMTEEQAPHVSALFDAIARDEIFHFRRLGELILALGGTPTVHTTVHVEPLELPEDVASRLRWVLPRCLRDCIREEQSLIDRYETLIGKTSDRVVRSILAEFVADEQRHITLLCNELNDKYCD